MSKEQAKVNSRYFGDTIYPPEDTRESLEETVAFAEPLIDTLN